MPHLALSDEEEAVLAVELVQLISRAKYPFSDRVRTLGAILNKLRPEPAREHLLPTANQTVSNLWASTDPNEWDDALERYWTFVRPENLALERSLDALDLDRLRRLDARGWYDFLHDEYFRWKYTAPNRHATTTSLLRGYARDEHSLDDLDQVRQRLLTLDTDDIRSALGAARAISGLGPSGASGLLALMYPHK